MRRWTVTHTAGFGLEPAPCFLTRRGAERRARQLNADRAARLRGIRLGFLLHTTVAGRYVACRR